ncbi:MAG TPA: hypothetical protein VGK22_16615 [Candidatus Angelobacter sp.]|jgi:hypothetical protein
MSAALAIYTVVYVVVSTVTIVADLKSRRSLWETGSDVFFLPLGLAGIVLYGFGAANPGLKLMWRMLAPLIVVGQVATNLLGRTRFLTHKRSNAGRDAIWVADIVTIILLLPMFATNLIFAFR